MIFHPAVVPLPPHSRGPRGTLGVTRHGKACLQGASRSLAMVHRANGEIFEPLYALGAKRSERWSIERAEGTALGIAAL